MNKNIENLKINKEAFKKSKKFKLYAIGTVMTAIALGSGLALETNTIQNNNQSNYTTNASKNEDSEPYFAVDVHCNFTNYENVKKYDLVFFVNENNEIKAGITINSDGECPNPTIRLTPGTYTVIDKAGGKFASIEIEIPKTEESYTLDVDSSTGEMQFHQTEQSHTLAK